MIFTRKKLNLIVGLVVLLFFLWAILYAVPTAFITLFHTLVGNTVLLIITLFTFFYNKILGIGLAIIFIILFRFSRLSYLDYK
jgi:hypothetical protein